MIPVKKIAIGNRVALFFEDESFMPELSAQTAATLLEGTEWKVLVELSRIEKAESILVDLAEKAGWTVERGAAGIFLVGKWAAMSKDERQEHMKETFIDNPVKPGSEPVASHGETRRRQYVTVEELGDSLKAVPGMAKVIEEEQKALKGDRKYQTLSVIFFKGSPEGQINSVYKTRETNPQKVLDFKAALEAGDCMIPAIRSKAIRDKLREMEIMP
jgi:hypothetical protein